MVGIIIVSENKEGQEMLKTVHRLLGKTSGMKFVMLKQGTAPALMLNQLGRTIAEMKEKFGELLLLTDLLGCTQYNICNQFLGNQVAILTGFSLPMVLKLATQHKTHTLAQLEDMIMDYGRSHIHLTVKKTAKKKTPSKTKPVRKKRKT